MHASDATRYDKKTQELYNAPLQSTHIKTPAVDPVNPV